MQPRLTGPLPTGPFGVLPVAGPPLVLRGHTGSRKFSNAQGSVTGGQDGAGRGQPCGPLGHWPSLHAPFVHPLAPSPP